MLVKFDISAAHALAVFVCHLRNGLSRLVHEVMLNEPLAHKLFRQLLLRFALFKLLFVAVSVEVAAAVGSVNLVNEINLAVVLSELIFCVDENQAVLGGNLLSTFKQLACLVFNLSIVFCTHYALSYNLFL